MEGSRYKIEGLVQPNKTTSFVREESQDVGCDTQPAVAALVSAGLRWSLSYLIYPRRVNSCSSVMIGWLHFAALPFCRFVHVVLGISFIFNKMSQTVKDLTAGTAGGVAQVKPLL